MEALRTAHRHQARDRLLAAEVGNHPIKRDIRQSIRVVREELRLVGQVFAHPQQALADGGMQTRIDEGDIPVSGVVTVELDAVIPFVQSEVAGHGFVVVQEIVADQVAAVSKAQDEIAVSEMRVVAHEVPQDRPVADLEQRL